VTLFTETDEALDLPEVDIDESQQADKLVVYNDGSVSDDVGLLANPNHVDGLAAIYEVDASEIDLAEFKNLSGLGMGGDTQINFGTVTDPDNKTFDGGITYRGIETTEIFLGTGNDTFTVEDTAVREDFRTLTIVNTGAGDDTVTVSVAAEGNGLLAVNLEEGDDTFNAAGDGSLPPATLEMIVFGGEGNDTIRGGDGNDTIFGDKGQVDYRNAEGELVTRLGLGLHERSDDPLAANFVPDRQTDGGFNQARTFAARAYDVGGDDIIDGFGGFDVIFGGAGSDMITAEQGGKIILGDNGKAELFLSSNNVETIADEIGATDYIIGGADGVGNIMLGGAGDDELRGGSGDDVILGDGGRVYRDADFNVTRVETTSPSIGGADDIQGGAGFDVIMGGAKGDTITAPEGGKIILGDNGV